MALGFSTLLDIDKLTQRAPRAKWKKSFSTLLDIDKLTPCNVSPCRYTGFSTLLDIDKLTLITFLAIAFFVLVLCWILINLHRADELGSRIEVLVLCWILINLHGESIRRSYRQF